MLSSVQATARALFLVLALALGACAGQQHTLKLSQVSTGLRPFEGSPYDALTLKPVHYSEIGEPEYDKFFREAAAVYGSMLFAIHVVKRTEDIVAGKVSPTPLDVRLILTVATDTLPRTHQRAIYLYNESLRLREKMGADFFWKFYKIPKARSAVNEARDNLLETKRLIPELAKRVQELHTKVEWHKMIEKSF